MFHFFISTCNVVRIGGMGGTLQTSATAQLITQPQVTSSAFCSLHCKRTKNLNFPLTEAYLWYTRNQGCKQSLYTSSCTHTHTHARTHALLKIKKEALILTLHRLGPLKLRLNSITNISYAKKATVLRRLLFYLIVMFAGRCPGQGCPRPCCSQTDC